jgi:hypothetical protein
MDVDHEFKGKHGIDDKNHNHDHDHKVVARKDGDKSFTFSEQS